MTTDRDKLDRAIGHHMKKWEPLLKDVDGSYAKRVTKALLEQEARHIKGMQKTEVGPFEKFVFPLIRRANVGSIGSSKKKTPLQELAERALAEHDPTDDDWADWVAEVEATYQIHKATGQVPEELQKEWDRIQRIEHPERFERRSGGGFPSLISQNIVSVQPMTQPVGGIAFYRPRYGKSKNEDADDQDS